MGTASRSRRRVGPSRRGRQGSRYLAASFVLHVAVIAAAALLFARPPDAPIPIEVSIILETGETEAGQLGGPKSEQQAAQPAPQQAIARPGRKPAAPFQKPEARKIATPPSQPKSQPKSPPKPAPLVQQTSAPPVESPPVTQAAPPSIPTNAEVAPTANETGGGAGATGGGQQSASASGAASGAGSGGGAGRASGGGTSGRGANDYLERVRAALAKHKRYPDQARKLKQEGTVRISLHLARDGTVLGAQIATPSGFPLLDEAAVQMARDASPVPRVPDDIDGDSVKIALPVTFSIGFFGRF